MAVVIAILVGAVVVVAVVVVVTRSARGESPTISVDVPGAEITMVDGRAIVKLQVTTTDATNPAVVRLVDDAAHRIFRDTEDTGDTGALTEVEVRNRDGVTLGTRRREQPRTIALPEHLAEPHAPRGRAPQIPGSDLGDRGPLPARPAPADAADVPAVAPDTDLAHRLELPDEVRARLRDASDPVDLVRAILEAAGLEPQITGDVLKVGDRAVVVIRCPIGGFVDSAALNAAFSHFKESGARRGVVLTPGSLSIHDCRRRQALEPNLLHAGPDGIQRMADAAGAGADPIEFAATPMRSE